MSNENDSLNVVFHDYSLGMRIIFFYVLLVVAFFSQFVNAQTSIRVIDAKTGEAVQYAEVEVYLSAKDSVLSLPDSIFFTDHNGEVVLPYSHFFTIKVAQNGYVQVRKLMDLVMDTVFVHLMPVTYNLSQVNVNASLLNDKLTFVPIGLSVINSADIKNTQGISLTETLQLIPGVSLQDGTYTTNRVVIRGVGSRSPYGSNRIKAYIDEFPLTNGDGSTSIEDIDPLFVARMEVLKGTLSALYGSGLGGTVRLYSNALNQVGTHGMFQHTVGEYGLRKTALLVQSKQNMFGIFAGGSSTYSNGYRENNQYRRNSLTFKAYKDFPRGKLSFLLNYISVNAEIPSSLDSITFAENPRAAAANWKAVQGFEQYERLISGLSFDYKISSKIRNYSTFFTTWSDGYEARPFNILDDGSSRFGFRQRILLSHKHWKFSTGLEYFNENYNWRIFETLSGSKGSMTNNYTEKRSYLNVFALSGWNITDRLKLDMALNFNTLHYVLNDVYGLDGVDRSGEYSYTPVFSPRVGLAYQYLENNTAYVALSNGFSAPSVEEALLPDGAVNVDLKPESGYTAELGFRGLFASTPIQYDLSFYSMWIQDMLTIRRLSEDVFTGINAGKTFHMGVELGLTVPIVEHENNSLHVHGSYWRSVNQFVDFVDDGTDYSGKKLPGIAKDMASIEIVGTWTNYVNASLMWQNVGKQYMNDANSKVYNAYSLMNAKVSYSNRFTPKVKYSFDLGIKNIYNTHFASMILVNAPSFNGRAPRYYYPGLPRNIYAALTVAL